MDDLDDDAGQWDNDDNDAGALLATFTECQRCGWKGLAGEGKWTCPKCKTEWQEVVLTVPAAKVEAFLKAATDLMASTIGAVKP